MRLSCQLGIGKMAFSDLARCAASIVLVLVIAACKPAPANPTKEEVDAAVSWYQWHDQKRAVEQKIDKLWDAPGGADCPSIVDAYRASGWPADVIDLKIAGIIISCHTGDPVKGMPNETLTDGIELLEKVTQISGQSQIIAPQRLRLRFERSHVGKVPNKRSEQLLNPQLAACWMSVEKDSYDEKIDQPEKITECIALRKKLGIPRED
jgi:hypothetical protein